LSTTGAGWINLIFRHDLALAVGMDVKAEKALKINDLFIV
jgi:hypothetical protein